MHWIGPTLLALSLILLALALRGRTTARGLFCRRCKFDLQGLNPARDNPACPECGRDLRPPHATRQTLRRIRRLPLLAAVLLQIVAVALLLIQAPGAGPRIIAHLPDAQVVRLAALEVDAAIDALAARTTRTPPMATPDLARAVELALAHQADASQPWDPRWGEVLAEAIIHDRMTDDQIARYLTHGFERQIQIRDRVNRPDADIGYRVITRAVRMHRLPTAQTHYSRSKFLRTETVSIGAITPGASNRGPGGGSGSGLTIPNDAHAAGVSTMGSSFSVRPEDWTAEEPADELTVRAEFRVTLRDSAASRDIEITTLTAEQRVRLLPSSEPVVATLTDPAAAQQAAAAMGVEPFAILPVLPTTLPPFGVSVAQIGFRVELPSHAAAGWLYIVDPATSQEIRIRRIILHPTGPNPMATQISWTVSPASTPEIDPQRVIAVAEAVLNAGVATLVFRTDPTTAESTPGIDAVLDLAVVFHDVPVHRAQTEADLTTTFGNRTDIRGTPAP